MTSIVEIKFLPSFQKQSITIHSSSETSLRKALHVFSQHCGIESLSELRFLDVNSYERIFGDSTNTVGSIARLCSNTRRMFAEVEVYQEICGGKGGFGSMLRTIGAQIEKTTNREACRDLQGRRMRDVEREKRIRASGITKTKTKIENMTKKKEAAKKKLENLINNPGASKKAVLEEPLIVTDIFDKIDEDLEYFQTQSSTKLKDSQIISTYEIDTKMNEISESSQISDNGKCNNIFSSEISERTINESIKDIEFKKNENKKESIENNSEDDDEDDEDLGTNFWSAHELQNRL